MNADLLLKHYEQIGEAPDAITRLRRFVLDLAVRGQIVHQELNDESVARLLQRIRQSKNQMVENGEIRKPRDFDNGAELSEPFAIPEPWRWVRLDGVGVVVGGGTPPAADAENFTEPGEGIPWLTPADLGGFRGVCISHGARDISEKGLRSSSATLMPAGTVLFTSRAPIGYVAIAACPLSTNQGFKSIVPFLNDLSTFIALVMKAFAREIDARAPGTTFREVSGKIVAAVPFPLPPLAEQHRIVAKVDELMALCDRLEKSRAERDARRNRMTSVAFARLNEPDIAPATFAKDVGFVLRSLKSLTTRPKQIKPLRDAVLDLAVRGKLVPQDPNDETASNLLERIYALKARLTQDGILRKEKPVPPVGEDEGPFAVPTSWCWARIGAVSLLTDYGTSVKSDDVESGVPVIKMGDIQGGRVILGGQKKVPHQIGDLPQLFLNSFDLLYNRTNSAELVGKTGIYLGDDDSYTFASYLIRIRVPTGLVSPSYVNLVMNAPYFRATQIVPELQQECGQANVNGSKLRSMLLPMPPLTEQHRIVSKVDELTILCDRLEAGLVADAEIRNRLLDALLAVALGLTDQDAA